MTSSRRASGPLVLSLALLGALAATLVAPSAAHAESAPPSPRCRVRLLPSGAGVPANLPAFVVDDRETSPGLTAGVKNITVTGGSVPLKLGVVPDPKTPKVLLLVPSTNDPLESGATYDVTYTTTCSAAIGASATPDTESFTAAPAATLPTTIGTATELENGTASIALGAELKAFRSTTRFDVSVDGASVGATRYGQVITDDVTLTLAGSALYFGGASVPTPKVCTTTTFEKHSVTLVAHVAGTEADTAPLTFSMGVDCAKVAAATPSLPDAGADDRGASGGGDGGCAVGGGDPYGSVAGVFALGAALAVAFRRRRRKTAMPIS